MATLETIAAAINQIDSKKQSLKRAFDDLQAHSSLLSPSFFLSWPDLDRHFSSLQASLSHRLRLLQSLNTPAEPAQRVNSELRALCEEMNGRGLAQYVRDHMDVKDSIKSELSAAIRCARDPAAMVLDAIEGFDFKSENSSSVKSAEVRRAWILLLECLMEIDANLGSDMKKRAKKVASDWRRMEGFDDCKGSEALGFLHFVAAYELGSEFQAEELVDFFFLISRNKQATFLCKKIGLGDKVADLIQKLIDSGKAILSIKFIVEFHVIDRFQPVPILKSYLEDAREAAQKLRKQGRNSLKKQNMAIDKEMSALKAVIKVIKEHELGPEFSQENLEKRVEELEKELAENRRKADPARVQQRQWEKKRPRGGPPNASNSTVPSQPQPVFRPEGALAGHPGPYQVNPYGSVNPSLGVGLLPGLYGSGVAGPANANAQLRASEPNGNPVYYGGQTGYVGFALPTQYHPPFYPR